VGQRVDVAPFFFTPKGPDLLASAPIDFPDPRSFLLVAFLLAQNFRVLVYAVDPTFFCAVLFGC